MEHLRDLVRDAGSANPRTALAAVRMLEDELERIAPRYGPIPPNVHVRTWIEQEEAAMRKRLADHRRRQAFDRDDPPAW